MASVAEFVDEVIETCEDRLPASLQYNSPDEAELDEAASEVELRIADLEDGEDVWSFCVDLKDYEDFEGFLRGWTDMLFSHSKLDLSRISRMNSKEIIDKAPSLSDLENCVQGLWSVDLEELFTVLIIKNFDYAEETWAASDISWFRSFLGCSNIAIIVLCQKTVAEISSKQRGGSPLWNIFSD